MCRKALCSLFPLGLPPDLLFSTFAQLPNITQAMVYLGVTVSMSGNRIDEQLFDNREESAMTTIVQGETLIYRQDGREQVVTVGTADWFAWLETASSFSFVSEEGLFTARSEQAGHKRGGWYWKAYRKQHGKLSSRYLGKSEAVTLARLQTVADALVGTLPDTDADQAAVRSAQAAAPGLRSDALPLLLATKFHRPLPRANLVRRPQLAERLTQGVMGPLTLVSAPAGFGKTTLLAQWLAESGMPAAWLSLEPGDNEPVRFLSYLIAALQTLDAHLGAGALAMLQMSPPAAAETVLTLLTNDVGSYGQAMVVTEEISPSSWMTTTCLMPHRLTMPSPISSSTCHHTCTWSSPPVRIHRCHWPGYAPGAT